MLLFTQHSPYKKRARFVAMLWTLLIFVGCLMPSGNIPHIHVALMDKWVHFIFFGGFTFLWLCANPGTAARRLFIMLLMTVAVGSSIEFLQGALPSLGRSSEMLDIVADGIGGVIGIALFIAGVRLTK